MAMFDVTCNSHKNLYIRNIGLECGYLLKLNID